MVRNMGRNCYGGICRAISLEGGGAPFLLEIEAIAAV
jgi:hypothetical protein